MSDKDDDKAADDSIALLHGAPGPYLESETSFFGRKRVDPSMKDARMETDCGGMLITKGTLTYDEADTLAAFVDLSDYPAFVAALTSNVYWMSPYEKPKPLGVYYVGEVWWSIYSYLTTLGYLPGSPNSYNNGNEYLYNEVLKRLVTNGVFTADSDWKFFQKATGGSV